MKIRRICCRKSHTRQVLSPMKGPPLQTLQSVHNCEKSPETSPTVAGKFDLKVIKQKQEMCSHKAIIVPALSLFAAHSVHAESQALNCPCRSQALPHRIQAVASLLHWRFGHKRNRESPKQNSMILPNYEMLNFEFCGFRLTCQQVKASVLLYPVCLQVSSLSGGGGTWHFANVLPFLN